MRISNFCRALKNEKGFTLIELLVVLVIIGILIAIAVPMYNKTQATAEERACQANLRTLEGIVVQYKAEKGNWPKMNDLLNEGYLKTEPKCPSGIGEGENATDSYKWNDTNHTFECPNDHKLYPETTSP